MSRHVWTQLREAMASEGAAVLVTVLGVAGSAPREAGARLVLRPSGGFNGTIGGGELEWQVLADARQLLENRDGPPVIRRSFSLGPDLGQCCGGRVELLLERFTLESAAVIRDFAEQEKLGPFVTRAPIGRGDGLARTVARRAPDPAMPAARLTEDGILEERFGGAVRSLYLFGAGHVGRALALALAPLPFAVTWVDSRPDAFPKAVPGNVTCRKVEAPADLLGQAPDGAFVLVMTHSHALDQDITRAALAAGRFGYVGLIGSETKKARFVKRMREAGLAGERIAELVCPIGIAGIEADEPAVIAASTVAQLLLANEVEASSEQRVLRMRETAE